MADESNCILCGEYASRFCTSCGHLCISHTCDHLRSIDHEVIEVEEEGYPEDGDTSYQSQTEQIASQLQEYHVVTESLRSYLSDEVMIASMTDELLSRSLERYKHILKVIEREISNRGNGNRPHHVYYRGGGLEPRRNVARSTSKQKSPLEKVVRGIKSGKITKDFVLRILNKER